MPPKEILDLGAVGVCLVLLWKGLDIAKLALMSRKSVNGNGIPLMSQLACQLDPQHFSHIAETHSTVAELKTALDAGHIGCVWRGRDEVRDLLELMRRLLDEMRGLRTDMGSADILTGEGRAEVRGLGDLMRAMITEIQGLRKDLAREGGTARG